MQHYLKKIIMEQKSDPKFGWGAVVPRKKMPDQCPSLRPSNKELLEWHSSMFRHSNTPVWMKQSVIYITCCISLHVIYIHKFSKTKRKDAINTVLDTRVNVSEKHESKINKEKIVLLCDIL
jgi:hypothetical protein